MSYEEPMEDSKPEFDKNIEVKINIPIPSEDIVADYIARDVLYNYQSAEKLRKIAEKSITNSVDRLVTEKVGPILEYILSQPIQPTDNFGNAVGDPTTLQGVLSARVNAWCNDIVDSEGNPARKSDYPSKREVSRIAWMLGKIVHGELKKETDREVNRIIGDLKAQSTEFVAKLVAEKITGLVIK